MVHVRDSEDADVYFARAKRTSSPVNSLVHF
jgi:hypothetical protein